MESKEFVYALIAVLAVVMLLLLLGRRKGQEASGAASKSQPKASTDAAGTRRKAEGKPPRELAERQELDVDQESPKSTKAAKGKSSRPPRAAEPASRAPATDDTDDDAAAAAAPSLRNNKTEESSKGSRRTDRPKPRTPDVGSLRRGLAKSRAPEGFFGRLKALLVNEKELPADVAEDIEEVLLSCDVGVHATETILERVRTALTKRDINDAGRIWQVLREEARKILDVDAAGQGVRAEHKPAVVLLVGVNGAGKTTTIGKLATRLSADGQKCILAAGDTFRAAAVQQLVVWGERAGCEVVRGKEGGDPASVIFDAIRRAKETDSDFVLADTAGRLHTKANLIQEIQKVVRSASKALDGAPHELLLVIDATNGQNALAQAAQFREALPLTGIVLTKLDGTAKGGVVLGICDALKLPVRYIGLGERADDLRDFSSDEFLEALLGKDSDASAA